jgi:outer membrane protein TolC
MAIFRAARAHTRRWRWVSRFAVTACLWLVAQTAAAALTLQEAQRLAVERSRQLVAQDSAATAAREMAVSAGQLPDPVATVGINNLPINGPDQFSLTRDFMTMTSVGVMQEFTRQAKREARAERFERQAEESLAERVANVAAIQRDAALAWLDRYYAEAMQRVISEQSHQAQIEIEAVKSEYRAGRGNLADILAARSALVLLEDRASEVGRKVSAAKIALARWIGIDPRRDPVSHWRPVGARRLRHQKRQRRAIRHHDHRGPGDLERGHRLCCGQRRILDLAPWKATVIGIVTSSDSPTSCEFYEGCSSGLNPGC